MQTKSNDRQNNIIVRVENLKKYFPVTKGAMIKRKVGDIKAVDDVTFDIFQGETLGMVGESGCGKTTMGRTISRLYDTTSGNIYFKDENIAQLKRRHLTEKRKSMQMIFQDPYASLNPRMTLGSIISEPFIAHRTLSRRNRKTRVEELMSLVGLHPSFINRFPHEFSGGQRQRIGIARALALDPDFIICDEPISALDVSIQAQIVNLLEDLQKKLGLTYLFIAHDLSMVRHISDRVAVMYLGKIVELADRDTIYTKAAHPYTIALLSAINVPNPEIEKTREQIVLKGDLPSPANPPKGCNFCTRCQKAQDICFHTEPEYREIGKGHYAACHLRQPSL